jgi:hypothetical protein
MNRTPEECQFFGPTDVYGPSIDNRIIQYLITNDLELANIISKLTGNLVEGLVNTILDCEPVTWNDYDLSYGWPKKDKIENFNRAIRHLLSNDLLLEKAFGHTIEGLHRTDVEIGVYVPTDTLHYAIDNRPWGRLLENDLLIERALTAAK